MKTSTALFAAILPAFMLFQTSAIAQDNFTIKSTMKMDGLPPEMAAMGEMEMITIIKGDNLKSETTSMMGSQITYFDGTKYTMLSDQMGNKSGYTTTKTEMDALDAGKKTEKPKIEYVNEKKTIAGYECSKAIVTTISDKKEVKTTIWYTEKLNYKNNSMSRMNRNGADLSDLKGYPLGMELSMSMQGSDVQMQLTTTEVSLAPVDDSVFKINTDGYKMMTYQEMKDKMKAAGRH